MNTIFGRFLLGESDFGFFGSALVTFSDADFEESGAGLFEQPQPKANVRRIMQVVLIATSILGLGNCILGHVRLVCPRQPANLEQSVSRLSFWLSQQLADFARAVGESIEF